MGQGRGDKTKVAKHLIALALPYCLIASASAPASPHHSSSAFPQTQQPPARRYPPLPKRQEPRAFPVPAPAFGAPAKN